MIFDRKNSLESAPYSKEYTDLPSTKVRSSMIQVNECASSIYEVASVASHISPNKNNRPKPPQFPDARYRTYGCFKCSGQGCRMSKKGTLKKCSFCKGLGYIDSTNPLVPFIQKIVEDRVLVILKQLGISQKPLQVREIEVPQVYPVFDEQVRNYQYDVPTEYTKYVECQYGKNYHWMVRVKNTGQDHWPNKVKLFEVIKESGAGEAGITRLVPLIEVKGLAPNEQCNINLNLNAPKKQTVLHRVFTLGYGEGHTFGPKIGHDIDTRYAADSDEDVLDYDQEIFRLKILEASNSIPNQPHPIKYLFNRLKQMRISEKSSIPQLKDIITQLMLS